MDIWSPLAKCVREFWPIFLLAGDRALDTNIGFDGAFSRHGSELSPETVPKGMVQASARSAHKWADSPKSRCEASRESKNSYARTRISPSTSVTS